MSQPVCPDCGGSGVITLPRADRREPTRVANCACQARTRLARLAAASGIPPRFTACSLDNYQPADGQRLALEEARTLAQLYPAHDKGLLLFGGAGRGKTHLAAAIGTALLARGCVVKFADYGMLLDAIRDSFNGTRSEGEVLDPFVSAPVLILDDLGARRRVSDWSHDMITRLIDYRYAQLKNGLLIVTTNRGPDAGAPGGTRAPARPARATRATGEVPMLGSRSSRMPEGEAPSDPAAFAARAESLEELFDERLLSRLLALCKPVAVGGPDRRRSPA